MHEPDGYREANDLVLDRVASSNGTLRALCRVQPRDAGAVAEARRCLDAGASGIKLHPRAEQFTLSEPSVRDLVAAAHERRGTVLIHAGRGIPALGQDTVHLAEEFHDARLILAHCAISDLAWLWRELPRLRNVFIDTAWWNPADLIAMFSLCPPANIVWASDSPYGLPLIAATQTMRCAFQAGLSGEQVRGVMGAQVERMLDGDDPLDLGPPPGPVQRRSTRCSTASSPTSRRRWAGRSHASTSPSRWRSRGSRARSARTAMSRRGAARCWSCSTPSTSTSRRPRTAGRSRPPRGCWCSR